MPATLDASAVKSSQPLPAECPKDTLFHKAAGWPGAKDAKCVLMPILRDKRRDGTPDNRPHVFRIVATTPEWEKEVRGGDDPTDAGELIDGWYYATGTPFYLYVVRADRAESDALLLDCKLREQGGPVERVIGRTRDGRAVTVFEPFGPGCRVCLVALLTKEEAAECL